MDDLGESDVSGRLGSDLAARPWSCTPTDAGPRGDVRAVSGDYWSPARADARELPARNERAPVASVQGEDAGPHAGPARRRTRRGIGGGSGPSAPPRAIAPGGPQSRPISFRASPAEPASSRSST